MNELHSLLSEQLSEHLGSIGGSPDRLEDFVRAVDAAYKAFDAERERLSEALEQERRTPDGLKSTFEAFPDLFIWTDAEGRILNTQGSDDDYLIPARDMIGRRLQDVPTEGLGDLFHRALGELRGDKRALGFEYKLFIKGERRTYEARLVKLKEDQRLTVIRNITLRKRTEEARMRSSRLDSIGLLAGGIAHDFNNLLTIVLANLSLARMLIGEEEEVAEILDETRHAALRTRELTHQLLTFSKGGSPIRKTTSVVEIIKESANFSLHGSKVTCDFDFAEDLLPVEIDQGQIGLALGHLIINADQAMPEGGLITIVASNVPAEEVPSRTHAAHYVRIAVLDRGEGIEEAHLERIFDPYFTTRDLGSGLGLTTCHSIIKKHEGTIAVSARPGGGTCFQLFLPASDSALAPRRSLSVGAEKRRGRVLLMDDEEDILRSTGRMLGLMGYEVVCARHGAEALDIFTKDAPFDLLIMDLTIPGGVGGAEAITHIREIDPEVKAIVSSGYSNNPVMANHRKHGFQGVLAKPYDFEGLQRLIDRLLQA